MNEDAKMNQVDAMPDPSRRKFLNSAALAGLAGAGLSVGLSACNKDAPAPAAAPAAAPAPAAAAKAVHDSVHLKPGELDTYYGLWSGGHTGDFRVLGLPLGPRTAPRALLRSRRAGRLGHPQRVEGDHGHQARWQPALHRR